MIVRGTTPYHTFLLPLAAEDIEIAYVTYLQNGQVILDKNTGSKDIESKISNVNLETENANVENLGEGAVEVKPSSQLTLHLSQEDTLKFKFWPAAEKNIAVVQVRVLTKDGEAYASDPVRERVFGVLKDGTIPESNTDNE